MISKVEEHCGHHWVIDVANGPTSRGICVLCHEVREFENSVDESRWRTRRYRPRQPGIEPG